MLNSSTIRFATDTFGQALAFTKQALLLSKVPLDCTAKTAVNQIVITGNEPTGSARRVIFKIDDALYYFQNGTLTAYPYEGKFDDVISNGNDVSTLTAINNISAFVGKKIYPIIALQAPSDATEFPTIKIALDTSTSTGQLTNTVDSPVYEIADEPQTITKIAADIVIKGQASVNITVRLRNQDVWSNYMTLEQATGLEADAVQFKAQYSVTTAGGTDSAQIKQIAVTHSSGENIVTGSDAIIFSKVQNYGVALQTCYVVVRHVPLIDAEIKAYVNFMPEPKHRELIQIGMGTGSRQEYTLGNPDKNIVPTSIRLYEDDKPFYDFDFSTELSTVVLTAKKNSVITASYDYKYGAEEWLEMNPRLLQPYNDAEGTYTSRFYLNLRASDALGKQISNVMIRLKKLSGTATESLGEATGKKQLFTLQHKAIPSTISFTGTVDFSYDEESGILALVAAKGTALNVAYNWQGENITVRSFAAGWIPTAGYDYQEGDYEYSIAGGGSDYVLPTMAPNVKGGAKLGAGLSMSGDTLNCTLQGGDAQFLGFLDAGDWDNPSVTASWGQYFIDPSTSTVPEKGSVYLFDGFNWRDISVWDMVPALFAQGSYAHENYRYCPGDIFEFGNREDGKFGLYFVGSDNITGDPSVRIDSPEWVYGHEENDDNKIYFTALNGDTLALSDCDALEARIAALEASVGGGGYFKDNSTKMIATGGLDYRNIDDEYWAIDSQIGRGLDESFQSEVGRAPQVGDIVQYYAPGNDVGYTIRTSDKWVNLGYDQYPGGYVHGDGNGIPNLDSINPLLSIKDRQKLDSLTEPYQIGDGFYLQNNKLYLQIANANTLGGVKVGDGLQLNNSAALCLKAATASQLGGIKIGNGLVKDLHEVLSVDLPLSNADRKLLDYLHTQFDSQIPT